MYIKDGKRFDPQQRHVFGDIVYEGNILAFPEVAAAMGIEEVPEPQPPEGFSDNTHFRMEVDRPPFVIYEKRPEEQIRQFQLTSIPPVSPWQIRKALNALGLRDAVEQAIEKSDITTKDAWQYATEFLRTDPLVEGVGKVLGKSEKELDELFLFAASL